MITKTLSVDMSVYNSSVVWRIQQNEINARELSITLTNHGNTYDIPTSATVIFKWELNGAVGIEPCSFTGNVVTVVIPASMGQYKGVASCKLSIVESAYIVNVNSFGTHEEYLAYLAEYATSVTDSTSFKLLIEPDVTGDVAIGKTSEYQLLLAYIAQIEQMQNLLSHSGWKNITLMDGWVNDGSRPLQICKVGSRVYMRGTITGPNYGESDMFVIPSGYEPSINTCGLILGDNNHFYDCLIFGNYGNTENTCGVRLKSILAGSQSDTATLTFDNISYDCNN